MWASRPYPYDSNDGPIDLRKKVVLQRDLEQRTTLNNHAYRDSPSPPERWPHLPVTNIYPFMSERYGVNKCELVNDRLSHHPYGTKGALETAIRKLHHTRRLKNASQSPPLIRKGRSRSANAILEQNIRARSPIKKRSSSCPNLTVILPPPIRNKPSSLKPKSSFIQRSSGYISSDKDPTDHFISRNYHQDEDHHSSPIGGAKKRKSFIPVYDPYDRNTRSPTPYEEYYSQPEMTLRRQLQEQNVSPYFVHVYDYYQQLVQRLREHASPPGSNVRLPPPMSPSSADDDMSSDLQRKRPCRALTGKHVRQGTGASLSTLLTLRQKIQERQKAKEHQGFNENLVKNVKKNRMQKQKPGPKSLLNKIHNF